MAFKYFLITLGSALVLLGIFVLLTFWSYQFIKYKKADISYFSYTEYRLFFRVPSETMYSPVLVTFIDQKDVVHVEIKKQLIFSPIKGPTWTPTESQIFSIAYDFKEHIHSVEIPPKYKNRKLELL